MKAKTVKTAVAKAIAEDKKNKRFRANITLPTGKRKDFYSNKKNKASAIQEIEAKVTAYLENNVLLTGTTVERENTEIFLSSISEPLEDDLTVDVAFTEYLKYLEKFNKRSDSSIRQLSSFFKNWYGKYLGNVLVKNISNKHLLKIMDIGNSDKFKLSKKTLSLIKNEFVSFLNWCSMEKGTPIFVSIIKVPKGARKKSRDILDEKEIKKLLTSDKTSHNGVEVTDPLIYLYRYMLLTGVRPGEAIALKTSDFPEDLTFANITRSINDMGKLTSGKNQSAVRAVYHCELAIAALTEQFIKYPKKKDIYIWGNISSPYLRDRFQVYLHHNGIKKISPYCLRHTFKSYTNINFSNEEMTKTINKQFGHSKLITSYVHPTAIATQTFILSCNYIFECILNLPD